MKKPGEALVAKIASMQWATPPDSALLKFVGQEFDARVREVNARGPVIQWPKIDHGRIAETPMGREIIGYMDNVQKLLASYLIAQGFKVEDET